MTARSILFTENNGRVGVSEEKGKLILTFYPPSPNHQTWQENTLHDVVLAVQCAGSNGEELKTTLGTVCEALRTKAKKRFVPNMEGCKKVASLAKEALERQQRSEAIIDGVDL